VETAIKSRACWWFFVDWFGGFFYQLIQKTAVLTCLLHNFALP